ncbi:hypothetical protein LCGC14_2742440, partial [marine sediment metagenome]
RRTLANFSNTGCGKTGSAHCATHTIDAHVIMAICPNDIKGAWIRGIRLHFGSDAVVHERFNGRCVAGKRNFYVLNYEKFQQDNSQQKISSFFEKNNIDFLIADEVHCGKHRKATQEEKIRRKNLMYLRSRAEKKNLNVCVLGMTATPVINNLQEGKSLLQLVTGKKYNDLRTRVSVQNCMELRKHFVLNSLRYSQNLEGYEIIEEEVDASAALSQIHQCFDDVVRVDSVLLDYKIPIIVKHLKRSNLLDLVFVNILAM